MRTPTGGHRRVRRDKPMPKPNGSRRGGAEVEHHDDRAAGPAGLRADPVRALPHNPEAVQVEEAETLRAGLHAGVRALLHPRRRAGGDRRAAEEAEPVGGARGGVEDDAAQVREYVVVFSVVRDELHRVEGENEER
ncbi:unnamed protein product [Cuscuta epithymum]|uniref:Uncharacterized protein n=1 Tax=Cuscuta epithymum TaxID=186058 RepID=A0AAV0GJG3_9ASTE|nr:unnamed protein product [Cuscuta epithymum]